MKVLILPGFSVHNKEWIDEVAASFSPSKVIPAYWSHWKKSGSYVFSVTASPEKYADILGKDKFNIIAKSVGTGVALRLVPYYKDQIKKIILCGIPLVSLKGGIESYKRVYSNFEKGRVIIFQNESDPLGSFERINSTLSPILPNVKFIKGKRSDHTYPFYKEFAAVL